MVAQADFCIVKLDRTFTVGTFEELSLCRYKPVFVVSEDPAISTWLVAQLDIFVSDMRTYFHPHLTSLMNTLRLIDHGSLPVAKNKWMFVTYPNGI